MISSSLSFPQYSKSLLAWLLLHREAAAARSAVAFELWPEHSEADAFANLRRHIYLLTRKLAEHDPGTEWILTDHKTIGWNPRALLELDLDFFEAIADVPEKSLEAAALYRGELASDIDDAWVGPIRRRVHERFCTLSIRGARHFYARGEFESASGLLSTLLTHDPWREDVVRAMILMRARLGDRAGAIQQFEAFRKTLAQEIGVQPGSDLSKAVNSIQTEHFEEPFVLDPAERVPISARATVPRLVPRKRLGSYSFKGRQEVLLPIVECFEGAARPKGVFVAVSGEPGIGKSRLGREILDTLATHDIRGYFVTCSIRGRRPYGPVLELLSLPALKLILDRSVGAASQLVHEMSGSFKRKDSPSLFVATPSDLQIAIAASLENLGREQRALVVIDDVQWADGATLELLRLLRTLGGSKPHFLLLYRTGCEDASIGLEELRSIADLSFELTALDRESLRGIAAETLQGTDPTADVLDSIADAAAGNPLFAEELARYSLLGEPDMRNAGRLPSTIATSVQRRLSEFEAEERSVLEIAAVVGMSFEIDVVAHVAGLSLPRTRDVVRKARDYDIVKNNTENRFVSFSHALLREALLVRLLPDERSEIHRLIAQECERAGVPNGNLADVAFHWQCAGDTMRAVAGYVAAADYARRLYALRDALDLYARAGELCPNESDMLLRIRMGRAESLFGLGLLDDALASFQSILQTLAAGLTSDTSLRATLMLRISACEWSALRRRSATIWASRALAESQSLPFDASQRAEAAVALARAAVLRGDAAEALDYLAGITSSVDHATSVSLAGYRGLALGMLGQVRQAIAAVRAPSADMLAGCDSVSSLGAFFQSQGIVLGWLGDLHGARKSFDSVISVARRSMNASLESYGLTARGHVAYYAGDLRGARADFDAAQSLAGNSQVARLYSAALGLKIAVAFGDRPLASSLIDERLFQVCESSDDVLFVYTLTGALIEHCATFGDPDRAKSLLKALLERLKAATGLWYVFPSVLQLGDREDLLRASTLANSWAQDAENIPARAFASTLDSELALREGTAAKAISLAHSAISLFERMRTPMFVTMAEGLEQRCARFRRPDIT